MTKRIFISADHGMAIIAGLHLPWRAVPGKPHAQFMEALRADKGSPLERISMY